MNLLKFGKKVHRPYCAVPPFRTKGHFCVCVYRPYCAVFFPHTTVNLIPHITQVIYIAHLCHSPHTTANLFSVPLFPILTAQSPHSAPKGHACAFSGRTAQFCHSPHICITLFSCAIHAAYLCRPLYAYRHRIITVVYIRRPCYTSAVHHICLYKIIRPPHIRHLYCADAIPWSGQYYPAVIYTVHLRIPALP